MKVETLERAAEVVAQNAALFVNAVEMAEVEGYKMFPTGPSNLARWSRILGMVDVELTRDATRLFPPLVRVAQAGHDLHHPEGGEDE